MALLFLLFRVPQCLTHRNVRSFQTLLFVYPHKIFFTSFIHDGIQIMKLIKVADCALVHIFDCMRYLPCYDAAFSVLPSSSLPYCKLLLMFCVILRQTRHYHVISGSHAARCRYTRPGSVRWWLSSRHDSLQIPTNLSLLSCRYHKHVAACPLIRL